MTKENKRSRPTISSQKSAPQKKKEPLETQLSEAQALIEEKDNLFASLVSKLPIALFVKDAHNDFRFILWNDKSSEIFGLTEKQVLGKNDRDFFPPEQCEFFRKMDQHVMQNSGAIEIVEEPVDSKSLGTIFVRTIKTPLPDKNGKPRYLLGISENITMRRRTEKELQQTKENLEYHVYERTIELSKSNEKLKQEIADRKLVEETLRESEQRFRLMADMAPVLIWMSGTDKLCTYFNRVWLEFTGRSLAQEIGNGWCDGVHPDDYDTCLKTYVDHFEARRPFQMEYRLRRHDGEYRWIIDVGVPRSTPNGDFLGFIGSCLDITDRKRAEEQMAKANEELKRLSLVRSEFTSIVSHELRTPLTAIKEGIDIILEEIDGPILPAQKQTLAMTKSNVDRLFRLIKNVLNFSKMETGQIDMFFEKTNLCLLVKETCQFMKLAADKKNIKILIDVPANDLIITCDSDKMSQVLINLIDNAIKFTPKDGKILIQLETETVHTVSLKVTDSGIGIKKADHEKIFEMYNQSVENEIKNRTSRGGVGVGLAVCKKLITGHHGDIRVDSSPGQGTTFIVTLPREQIVENTAYSFA